MSYLKPFTKKKLQVIDENLIFLRFIFTLFRTVFGPRSHKYRKKRGKFMNTLDISRVGQF